jgi:hypothetical protein
MFWEFVEGGMHLLTSSRQVSIRLESERRIGACWVMELRWRLFLLSSVPVGATVLRMIGVRIGILGAVGGVYWNGWWVEGGLAGKDGSFG